MDVIEAIRQRRAVRRYKDQPLSKEAVIDLIELSVQAPSAIDLQPWAFAVVQKRQILQQISDASKAYLLGQMQDGSQFLRFRDMLSSPDYDLLYGAPVLIVLCATSPEQQAAEDCALAAQTLMLAAHASGLATCCIGLVRPWLNQPTGRMLLGIPPHLIPSLPVIIGHPAETPVSPGRRPPEVYWVDSKG